MTGIEGAEAPDGAEGRPKDRKRLHLRQLKGEPDGRLETVGAELRAARLKRGEELDAVAAKLKIRKDILQALEDSDYERQPPKVYAIGFVRAYARYLGLNAEALVKRYKTEIAGRTPDRAPALNFPADPEARGFPGASFLAVLLAASGLGYGAWVVTQPAATDEGSPIVVTEAEAQRLADEAAAKAPQPVGVPADPLLLAQQMAAPQTPAAKVFGDVSGDSRITLTASEECYVRVRDLWADNGPAVIFEQTLLKGESYRVPNRGGLSLRAGNAGALIVSVDGKDLGPLGKPGDTADRVSLTAQKLIARFEGGVVPVRRRPDPRDEPAPMPPVAPAQAPQGQAAPNN
jgi:cytoskeleton protein RodZ